MRANVKAAWMQTEPTDEGVTYRVMTDEGVAWEQTVRFGPDLAHHAGGAAFREAARAQERAYQQTMAG